MFCTDFVQRPSHLLDPVLGVTRRALGDRDGLSATAEFTPLAGTAEILLDGAQLSTLART